MKEKAKFLEKLNGLLKLAQSQGSQITIEEVKTHFSEDALTEEQIDLVFDYLLSQKVVVKGYVKVDEIPKTEFTEEEQIYLRNYMKDLEAFVPLSESDRNRLYEQAAEGDEKAKERLVEDYLKEVVDIAKVVHRPEVFMEDLVQEGNLGLVLGVEMISDAESAHETITSQIRQSMRLLLEEQSELKNRDKKMVEKVMQLDEAITILAEDLGRKVAIDELAVYMGMEIEEIEDILKLTGEEAESEEIEDGK